MNNLLQNFPATKFMTIIRNPVQGCEAWAGREIKNKSLNGYKRYANAAGRIAVTLNDLNCIEFFRHDSVGIRLEDIKHKPQETMQRLCNWLEIDYSSTLHEATIQGLQWWGDPGSSLFGKNQTQDHGKIEPIRRKLGVLFSESDRYILETLFYPVNVRFGYVENNQSRFQKDLQEIHSLLYKPLDFELNIATKFPLGYPNLENTAAYQAFHAMLLGRWRMLNESGTYPYMYQPLPG